MRWKTALAVVAALAAVTTVAPAQEEQVMRQNIGLLLDTPFLHQELNPYESTFYGAYGNERITYEYDERGMPVFIRYGDADSEALYLDVEVTYRPDDQIDTIVYLSYDDEGREIIYRDQFTFSEYLPTGPRVGLLLTSDGGQAEMRITYDEAGRLVRLEEDSAYAEGLFRAERYVWSDDGLPLAVELHYPGDDEAERYFYLYDANGMLRSVDGESVALSDTSEATLVFETYTYRTHTLREIFGRYPATAQESQSASR